MLKKIEVVVLKLVSTFLKKQNGVGLNMRREVINIQTGVSTSVTVVLSFLEEAEEEKWVRTEQGLQSKRDKSLMSSPSS